MKKATLLLALKVIKNECISSYSCESCPFYNPIPDEDISCGIRQNMPAGWRLIDDEPCEEKLMI